MTIRVAASQHGSGPHRPAGRRRGQFGPDWYAIDRGAALRVKPKCAARRTAAAGARLSPQTGHELRGGQDRNGAERMQRQEVAIAADDDVGAPVNGELEKLVVGRVAAGGDALDDLHRLGGGEQNRYVFAERDRRDGGDVRPRQHVEELLLGGGGFQQAAMLQEPAHDAKRQRIGLEDRADEDIRVDHDPHSGGGSTSLCACLIIRSISSSLSPAATTRRREARRASVSQSSGSMTTVTIRSFGTPRRSRTAGTCPAVVSNTSISFPAIIHSARDSRGWDGRRQTYARMVARARSMALNTSLGRNGFWIRPSGCAAWARSAVAGSMPPDRKIAGIPWSRRSRQARSMPSTGPARRMSISAMVGRSTSSRGSARAAIPSTIRATAATACSSPLRAATTPSSSTACCREWTGWPWSARCAPPASTPRR